MPAKSRSAAKMIVSQPLFTFAFSNAPTSPPTALRMPKRIRTARSTWLRREMNRQAVPIACGTAAIATATFVPKCSASSGVRMLPMPNPATAAMAPATAAANATSAPKEMVKMRIMASNRSLPYCSRHEAFVSLRCTAARVLRSPAARRHHRACGPGERARARDHRRRRHQGNRAGGNGEAIRRGLRVFTGGVCGAARRADADHVLEPATGRRARFHAHGCEEHGHSQEEIRAAVEDDVRHDLPR